MSGPRNSPLATTNPSSRAFRSRRGARHAARAVEWSLLAAGLLLLVGLLGAWQSLLRVDHLVQDATTGLQKRPPHPDIVVVAIDERSIAAIGRWPWRRALHAELLRQISLQEPQAIGMDILFTEEDTVNPVDDTLLANAIRSSGRVVLPVMMQTRGTVEQAVPPIPALASAAQTLGHVHLDIDADGITRRVFMLEGLPDHLWPHFSRAMLDTAGRSKALIHSPHAVSVPPDKAALAQWQRQDREVISFAGGQGHFPTLSYVDVLRGDIPAQSLRGKLVLVGATAVGIGDIFATPANDQKRLMPGVEISAHVLDGILQGRHVVDASMAQNQALNLLVVAAGLLGLWWLGPLSGLLLVAALIVLLVGWVAVAPLAVGVQFQLSAGLAGLALMYPLWSWRRLNAAADYLGTELARLAQEPSPLPPAAYTRHTSDFLDRRIDAVESASTQLRDLQNFVSDSLQQLPDATMVLDTQGLVLIANSTAAKHFGAVDSLALRALDAHQLLRDVVSVASRQPALVPGALLQSEPIQGEVEDYQGRMLLLKCVPFRNSGNVHTGWLLTLVDLTDARATQNQRDQALRFISHDIRAPQASILTLMELHRTHPGMMTEEELIQRVEHQARSALALAESFVYLTHAQSQEYTFEEVDLTILLEGVVDEAWALASERKIHVAITQNGPESAICHADPVLVRRALANILNNALKYGPAGSEVTCFVQERATSWAVSIHDAGPGINAENQALLFKPFQRLHQQSHPEIKGMGLGLTFVATVLHRHGGTIEIDSGKGAGCTFTVVLPRTDMLSATSAHSA